ncbi:MAG: hemerythrin domain-containing protein [Acidaminococcaceae bacterium]
MKPTDVLKEEHQGVKLSLRILEQLCKKINEGKPDEKAILITEFTKLLEFFKVFVDKCHHSKEEDVLFPALLDAGLPKQGGPIQVMLAEHDIGRKLVAEMAVALNDLKEDLPNAETRLVHAADNYRELLKNHIAKEDEVLYPMADTRISAFVQQGMIEEFEDIESEKIGQGAHEEFHKMLGEFKTKYLG